VTDQVHVFDDIPAYAMGALDSPDRERLEGHFAVCSLCQAELRAFQDVISAVAQSAPIVQPPARLKESILREAKSSKKPQASMKTPPQNGFWTALMRWLRPSPALAIGGALVVILLVSNLLLLKQVNDLSSMQRHGYNSVLLNGTDNAPDARGMIVYTQDGRSGFLVVNGLKPLPESNQYQLWLVKAGKRTSGGIFSVEQDGYKVLEVDSNMLLTGYDSFGITIEPAGGSPGPTGAKVMGGKF
jgi:anti-sigma-K factor RskA